MAIGRFRQISNLNFNIKNFRFNLHVTRFLPFTSNHTHFSFPFQDQDQEQEIKSTGSRIRTRIGVRANIPKSVRIGVWNRWIGETHGKSKCYVCNEQDIFSTHFECGHVVSVKDGGTNTIENLRPVCRSCNASMKTQNLELFRTKYFDYKSVINTSSPKFPFSSKK